MANKTDAQASLERIQNFEEAFARIRSATGIEDIEELVSREAGAYRLARVLTPTVRGWSAYVFFVGLGAKWMPVLPVGGLGGLGGARA